MKVSIVIPAYNEAEYLGDCLRAISEQTVRPWEVIVVDNNSTDETAAIARKFDFVTLISESRQGVVYARDAGFDRATGDIIGRIDVDTRLPKTWVETLIGIFVDPSVAAVSGSVQGYDVSLSRVISAVDLFLRKRLARRLSVSDTVFLQGANMGVRRSAWQNVSKTLCRTANMHEDFDLAIHLQELGNRVIFDERLKAGISARRTDVTFLQFTNYVRMSPHTYAQHNLPSRRFMYPIVALALIGYIPVRILYRGCDPNTGQFMLTRIFATKRQKRVDPTAFVH